MIPRTPRSTLTDTRFPYSTLLRSLDFRGALAELRRVAAKRPIIVVPQDREYRFTFNPHLHFFPYPHSFLRYATPVPASHAIKSVGRDIRSEKTTSELQTLIRISYAVLSLNKKINIVQ